MNTGSRGFFRKAFDAMVEARTRQARRELTGALLMLDDETLKQYGYSRKKLQRGDRSNAL